MKLEILNILYNTDMLTITEISEELKKRHIKNSEISEIIQLLTEMEYQGLIERIKYYADTDEFQYSIENKGDDIVRKHIQAKRL